MMTTRLLDEYGEPMESRAEIYAPVSTQDPEVTSMFWPDRDSGRKAVTLQKSLTLSAVFRAVSLVSGGAAKLPCVVYERVDGGKSRATSHPIYNLLLYKPCVEMTALTFFETLVGHALTHGNGYAYIKRNGAKPFELWPLNPSMTYPIRRSGELYYVTEIDGELFRLPESDVIHIKGLGFDGLIGYSVLACAQCSFSLGISSQEFGEQYFRKGAMPSAVLETPHKFTDEKAIKRIRDSWEKMHVGLENAHKAVILEQGLTLKPYSVTPKDSQFVELVKANVRDVANWFGVPPHKLGDSEKVAYNSIEQENQSFLDDCLDLWLRKIEAELRDKLLSEREKEVDSHVIEFMRQAFLRADMKTRYESYKIGVDGGWLSANDIRAAENQNSIGSQGDIYRVPLNTAPASKVGTEDDNGGGDRSDVGSEDDNTDKTRDVFNVVRDAGMGRLLRRLAGQADKAANSPDTFGDFLTSFESNNKEIAVDALHPALCVRSGGIGERVMIMSDAAASSVLRFVRKRYYDIYSHAPRSRFSELIKQSSASLFGDAIAANLLEWKVN